MNGSIPALVKVRIWVPTERNDNMKKSRILMFITLLVLVPLTIFFGSKLPGRAYYLTMTLVLLEIMLPFFLSFEGRKPQARELVVIAVLCALAVAGRVVIPIPNFKATYAIIMLSAVAFGPETGFLIGAMAALASNFFFGQGAHTPWQMMAYGLSGLLIGFLFQKGWLKRKKLSMAILGALSIVLLVGPLMDTGTALIELSVFSMEGLIARYLSGLPVNISQAAATFLVIFFLGNPFLEKLDRVKIRYGMMEEEDGI